MPASRLRRRGGILLWAAPAGTLVIGAAWAPFEAAPPLSGPAGPGLAGGCGPELLWALLVWALPVAACLLDRQLGDPRGCFHPVQAMGAAISLLQRRAEGWAQDRPWALRLAGVLLSAVVVGGSVLAGWLVERLALRLPLLGVPLLLAGLASALAGRSLEQAVLNVLAALPAAPPPVTALAEAPEHAAAAAPAAATARRRGLDSGEHPAGSPGSLPLARQRLGWIVGRDVAHLDEAEILRALAETASENGVDGLFAPLFWMLAGAALWCLWPPLPPPGTVAALGGDLIGSAQRAVAALTGAGTPLLAGSPLGAPLLPFGSLPGPLALAWLFKAASTLDSMLGYRHGRLRWLGTAGARLDDGLTWLPCRLVALSLPLLPAPSRPCGRVRQFLRALREGAPDPSPNAGVSQAAYALAAGVRLGGINRYRGEERAKALLAAEWPGADRAALARILALSRRLQVAWLLAALPLLAGLALARCCFRA